MASSSKRSRVEDSNESTIPLDIFELMSAAEDEELNLDEANDGESTATNIFELEEFSSLNSGKHKSQIKIRKLTKTTRGIEILTKTVVARIMNKTPLHTSANEKWRFFRMDLKDENSVESQIRLTFLIRQENVMIDVYYAHIEAGRIYSFKNLQLKQKDIRFCSLPHSCEVYFHFGRSTVASFNGQSKDFEFSFEYSIVPIASINTGTLRSRCIDILGKITTVTKPTLVTYFDRKTSREVSYSVCDVTVVDASLKAIKFSAWREDSKRIWDAWNRCSFSGDNQAPMILVKALKIIVRHGRITVKTLRCGAILIFDPATITVETQVEAFNLNNWYENEGGKYHPFTKMDSITPENYQMVREAMDHFIKHRHESDVSITSTALEFNVARTTLNLCLNKMGIRAQKVHYINPEATTRAALRSEKEKASGKSTTDIAEEEGVSYDAVTKRRQILGIGEKRTHDPEGSKRAVIRYTEGKKACSNKTLIECSVEEGVTYAAAKKANQSHGETRPMEMNPEQNRAIALYLIEKRKTHPEYTVSQAIQHHGQKVTKKRQDAVRQMYNRLMSKQEVDE